MPIEEYKEVSASLRTYASMRFSQLTLVSAVTGAAIAGINNVTAIALVNYSIPIIALLLTIAIWVMEESSTKYWNEYLKRAVDLEKELRYQHYSLKPKRKFLSASNAVRFLYMALCLFWGLFILIKITASVC